MYTGSMRRALLFISVLCVPTLCMAQERVEPQRLSREVSLTQLVNAAKSHAQVDVEGNGSFLHLVYTAKSPFTLLVLFGNAEGFGLDDGLQFSLPAGAQADVQLPLSSFPQWKPGVLAYRLFILSGDKEGVTFQKSAFEGGGVLAATTSLFSQAIQSEPYSPSTYHRLQGYTVFGMPLTPILGVLAFISASVLLLRKQKRNALILLLTFPLLCQARFSLDLLGFTFVHAREWVSSGTYAQAGYAYEIAKDIQKKSEGESLVAICTDGSSFISALLTYELAPLHVTAEAPQFTKAEFLVITQKFSWSHTETSVTCNGIQVPATLLKKYPDGSAVFFRTAP